MNCSVRTCAAPADVREPLPLCGTCALQVIAAYANVNLSGSSRTAGAHQRDVREEVDTIYRLLDSEGWNAVNLDRAMDVLGRPRVTAARRLAEARKRYASELNRRARRTA